MIFLKYFHEVFFLEKINNSTIVPRNNPHNFPSAAAERIGVGWPYPPLPGLLTDPELLPPEDELPLLPDDGE